MAGAVTFSFSTWITRYPEFAAVPQATAQAYFDEAGLYCANQLNPVQSLGELTLLLNMLTAHIAALNSNNLNPAIPADINNPVGRVSSATEGSVTAQFTNDYPPGTPQWYQQTRYGASYWTATLKYRTMRYRAPCVGSYPRRY